MGLLYGSDSGHVYVRGEQHVHLNGRGRLSTYERDCLSGRNRVCAYMHGDIFKKQSKNEVMGERGVIKWTYWMKYGEKVG